MASARNCRSDRVRSGSTARSRRGPAYRRTAGPDCPAPSDDRRGRHAPRSTTAPGPGSSDLHVSSLAGSQSGPLAARLRLRRQRGRSGRAGATVPSRHSVAAVCHSLPASIPAWKQGDAFVGIGGASAQDGLLALANGCRLAGSRRPTLPTCPYKHCSLGQPAPAQVQAPAQVRFKSGSGSGAGLGRQTGGRRRSLLGVSRRQPGRRLAGRGAWPWRQAKVACWTVAPWIRLSAKHWTRAAACPHQPAPLRLQPFRLVDRTVCLRTGCAIIMGRCRGDFARQRAEPRAWAHRARLRSPDRLSGGGQVGAGSPEAGWGPWPAPQLCAAAPTPVPPATAWPKHQMRKAAAAVSGASRHRLGARALICRMRPASGHSLVHVAVAGDLARQRAETVVAAVRGGRRRRFARRLGCGRLRLLDIGAVQNQVAEYLDHLRSGLGGGVRLGDGPARLRRALRSSAGGRRPAGRPRRHWRSRWRRSARTGRSDRTPRAWPRCSPVVEAADRGRR